MKHHLTLLVTLAGAMVGAAFLSAKAELEKQKDTSGVAPVSNEFKSSNSTRKTASSAETGQTKTQPEDVKLSAGISEIVKMVRSDTDSAVIQAYIENSPIAYYPSADEIIYLHQLGAPAPIVSALIRHGGELRARAAQAYKENQNRNPQPNSPTVVAPAAPSTVAAYNAYPDYGYSYPRYSYGYPYYTYPYYTYSYWSPFYSAYSYPRYCGYSGYRYGYCAPRYRGYAYNVGYRGGGNRGGTYWRGAYRGGAYVGGGYRGGGYRGGAPAVAHSGGGMARRGR